MRSVSKKAYVWAKIAKANTPIVRRVRLLKRAPQVPIGAGRFHDRSAWKGHPVISRVFNENWIHPLPDETPRVR
jgi:hypothetical protein